MTTSANPIVRRERSLPADRLLRDAARKAEAAGQAWELLVAVPPPALGISRERRSETLIVGDRAVQRHGLRLVWGRWDADARTLCLDDGRVFDITGSACLLKK